MPVPSRRRGDPKPRSGGHKSQEPEKHAEPRGNEAAEGYTRDDSDRCLTDRPQQGNAAQEHPGHKWCQQGTEDGTEARAKDDADEPVAGYAPCEFDENRERAKDGAAESAEKT